VTALLFIIGICGSIWAISKGDWHALFWEWVAVGLLLYVWQACCDAGRAIANAIPREQYNLTQNRYDLTESDDPTRPNENIPAIIEIGRHYERRQP
jgi:hypothetical protein